MKAKALKAQQHVALLLSPACTNSLPIVCEGLLLPGTNRTVWNDQVFR